MFVGVEATRLILKKLETPHVVSYEFIAERHYAFALA